MCFSNIGAAVGVVGAQSKSELLEIVVERLLFNCRVGKLRVSVKYDTFACLSIVVLLLFLTNVVIGDMNGFEVSSFSENFPPAILMSTNFIMKVSKVSPISLNASFWGRSTMNCSMMFQTTDHMPLLDVVVRC